MLRKTATLLCAAAMLLPLLAQQASAVGDASAKRAACTVLSIHGRYPFGIVVSGVGKARVTGACRTFAARIGSQVRPGNRQPFGWTWVARYRRSSAGLTATSVSPSSDASRVFARTNQPLFTGHGWTLVQRH